MNPYGKKKDYGHADIDGAHTNPGIVVWAVVCVVLFFFDRISAVHWQLRPGAGDKIAEALYGEEVRI